MSISSDSSRGTSAKRVASLVLLVALGAGLFARVHELGVRPLAVDEYYFARGVEAIVTHGVPSLPGGGYYTRGLLAQYTAALAVFFLGDTGFALRLPAVLFSLASALLLFLYAGQRLGRPLAATLAALLLLSSWEIEFARFARMYAALQFTTLLYLLAVDRAYFGSRWDLRYLPHFLALLLVLSHSLGILLLVLLFVPVLLAEPLRCFATRLHLIRFSAVSLAVSLLCFGYQSFHFRGLGVADALPEGFVSRLTPSLWLPEFPFWRVDDDFSSLALLVVVIVLVGAGEAGWRAWEKRSDPAHVLASMVVVATALHAFLVSMGVGLVLVTRYEALNRVRRDKSLAVKLALAIVIGVGWIVYALRKPDWITRVDTGQASLLGAMRQTFLGWPDLYSPLFIPWSRELPLLGVLIVSACAFQLLRNRKRPLVELVRNPATLLAFFCLAVGVLRTNYMTTRYSFFLYPVALYAIVLSVDDLTRRLFARAPARVLAWSTTVSIVISLALFSVTSDFNPLHIAKVASPEVGFRTGPFESFSDTWYGRWDYRSPADFIDHNLNDDISTRVIVVGQPPVSYYLRSPHAVYYDRTDLRFRLVSREKGTRDLWSQQPLLSTPDELRAHTAAVSRVFLVQAVNPRRQPFQPDHVWPNRLREAEPVFLSSDGRIEVLALSLDRARESR